MVLDLIYAVGKVVIRHILKTEFENYHVAKNYMRELEKKGLLNSTQGVCNRGKGILYN